MRKPPKPKETTEAALGLPDLEESSRLLLRLRLEGGSPG